MEDTARVFADSMTFDAERSPYQHLAFGYGTHYCPGAPSARLEAEIVFRQPAPVLGKRSSS